MFDGIWPFEDKLERFGLKREEDGGYVFDYTEEEQQEIIRSFKLFSEHRVNPDYADILQNGITSRAFSIYSRDQMVKSSIEESEESQEALYKAIAAIIKAYSVYQLPVYLYDLACLMELNGNTNEAIKIFELFLNRQSEYTPHLIDEALLGQYNVEQLILDTQKKIS